MPADYRLFLIIKFLNSGDISPPPVVRPPPEVDTRLYRGNTRATACRQRPRVCHVSWATTYCKCFVLLAVAARNTNATSGAGAAANNADTAPRARAVRDKRPVERASVTSVASWVEYTVWTAVRSAAYIKTRGYIENMKSERNATSGAGAAANNADTAPRARAVRDKRPVERASVTRQASWVEYTACYIENMKSERNATSGAGAAASNADTAPRARAVREARPVERASDRSVASCVEYTVWTAVRR
ncbi:unnamed protein product [Chrysodeixis includens]|uniref:Uncharacterized protein n=1 Tax=Chrysodeixis includens TaxID=689277 RepID=A0A9N8L6B9_CHRIL|nr:unnamed protein product [Chrysodeixis includens]